MLQTCVVTLGGAADVQIRRAKAPSEEEPLNLESTIVISITTRLLATVKALSIRPVVYPSALSCLTTSHRFVMLLGMIEGVDDDFFVKISGKNENSPGKSLEDWKLAVNDMKKSDSKWAKLSTTVPSTLVCLLRTQLELAIASIADPDVSLCANDSDFKPSDTKPRPRDHDLPTVLPTLHSNSYNCTIIPSFPGDWEGRQARGQGREGCTQVCHDHVLRQGPDCGWLQRC